MPNRIHGTAERVGMLCGPMIDVIDLGYKDPLAVCLWVLFLTRSKPRTTDLQPWLLSVVLAGSPEHSSLRLRTGRFVVRGKGVTVIVPRLLPRAPKNFLTQVTGIFGWDVVNLFCVGGFESESLRSKFVGLRNVR